jgi:hypothetical protein
MIASSNVSGAAATASSAKTGAAHSANKAENTEILNRRFITLSLASSLICFYGWQQAYA